MDDYTEEKEDIELVSIEDLSEEDLEEINEYFSVSHDFPVDLDY